MKNFLHALLLVAALASAAPAPTNLAGTWQGRLEVTPGTTIAIQFVIANEAGGEYSAVLNSPDSGAIKNVRAGKVKFADNQLTVDVPQLSGSYAGTLRDGILDGQWAQEGKKLSLSLRPQEKPALARPPIDVLRGEWFGKLTVYAVEATIVLRFSAGKDGAVNAVLDVPEQGVKEWSAEKVALDAGHFSVTVPAAQAQITGEQQGNEIVGQWTQLGNSVPLTLRKGRYVAASTYLDLPAATREQLAGRWTGMLGPLPMTLRFETDSQGRTLGFFDRPQVKIVGAPITEATLVDTQVTIVIAGFGGKYTGELAGDSLKGEWMQLGLPQALPLTLTREK